MLNSEETAFKALKLWIDAEIERLRPDTGAASKVDEFLKKRFKTDVLPPLLKLLGLIEVALIDEVISSGSSKEEVEEKIVCLVEDLAKTFPDVVDRLKPIVTSLSKSLDSLVKNIDEFSRSKGL